jgi:two-component system sensor histidine kinase QseC
LRSIRDRLALGLVAGLALLLGAGGAALYFRTKAGLERQDDAALLSKAWAIAASVRADEGEIDFEPSPALEAEFEQSDRPAAYEIRRRDGSLFARSHLLAQRELGPRASAGREPAFAWTHLREDRPAREVGFMIPVFNEESETQTVAGDHEDATSSSARHPAREARNDAGDPSTSSLLSTVHAESTRRKSGSASTNPPEREMLDEFSIRVVQEMPDTRATLAGLRATILAVITLAFLLSIVLVHFVLRRGLSPLGAMAAEAERIHADALDRRFSKEPLPAELEPIRTRLNDLLDRLQQSFERERRFNAAVAHELRTPIAELRALSEIALRWPERADAQENMADVSAVAQEMQSVIEALLTLRRVESGAEKVELEPVRVDEVVRAALATYAQAATARNQALSVELASEITLESHLPMLRSIVSNLISNAIEYAPTGSMIKIVCRSEHGRFSFSTTNPAPDLTRDDVTQMFEAFWRKDAVRTTGSHAGLGLTLTQSLAKVLNLALRAEFGEDGHLRMILE